MAVPLSKEELYTIYNQAKSYSIEEKIANWHKNEFPKIRETIIDAASRCKEEYRIWVPAYINLEHISKLFPGCYITLGAPAPCSSYSSVSDESNSYNICWEEKSKVPRYNFAYPVVTEKKEEDDIIYTPIDLFNGEDW